MMFQTNVGAVVNDNSIAYLRPETAQGIFTNYKNVVDSFYPDLPFGIAQQGKAFRNEISPRDFVFRSREFEQMEIEYFVNPNNWQQDFDSLLSSTYKFLTEKMGLNANDIHELDVPEEDRAHYSKKTIDIEFDYPIGREELMGIAYRTDFDLSNIARVSGKNMEYVDKNSKEKFIPHVIEPSFGVERLLMAILSTAYTEVQEDGKTRTYLKFPDNLAPISIIVAPLLKNKPALVEKAKEVYNQLRKKYNNVSLDMSGKIGKVYAKADEIGVPKVVVIDFDTIEKDGQVSVRNRDDASQIRQKADEI
ncbi:Glycine--tRNA ligase [Chlamydia trachomatis]|nr:Glycine--tRNA ligase [Chlamydia trachomatis]